jgi:hypothetical protein
MGQNARRRVGMLDVGESAVEKTNPIVRLLFACGGEAFVKAMFAVET